MAMQKTAAKLGPEVLRKYVKPIEGMVEGADPTALALKVVAGVVEKAEVRAGGWLMVLLVEVVVVVAAVLLL